MFAHIDVDSFFASVLQRKNPKLRGQPLLALGMGGGCVIAASYEAKAFGVKTGMTLKDARPLCPHAIAVPSDFSEALLASREIESILRDEGSFIEQASVDEWYLDVRALPRAREIDLPAWATNLQASVLRKTALTISIGVAPSKLLAKMAAEYRKPAGVTVIDDHAHDRRDAPAARLCHGRMCISDFLRDRPAAAIPGVGHRRVRKTDAHGWKTAYDVAHADGEAILRIFGRPGLELQAELRGQSVWAVETEPEPPKSISRCRSFRNTTDRSLMFSHLLDHLTYTTLKMRRHSLACTMIGVWLRDQEYGHRGWNAKLPLPAWNQDQLLPFVRYCFNRSYKQGFRSTQIGLALCGLRPQPSLQYSLFERTKKTEAAEQTQQALDSVHARYGRDALLRGSALPTRSGRRKNVYSLEDVAKRPLEDLRRAQRTPRA